jgi:proteasome alpha subunit
LPGYQEHIWTHTSSFFTIYLRFGEDPNVADVVEVIAGRQQEATTQGSTRPFGSSILVAGLTPGQAGTLAPTLYRADPSGTYTLWKAVAIGQVRGVFRAVCRGQQWGG